MFGVGLGLGLGLGDWGWGLELRLKWANDDEGGRDEIAKARTRHTRIAHKVPPTFASHAWHSHPSFSGRSSSETGGSRHSAWYALVAVTWTDGWVGGWVGGWAAG